MKMGTEPNDDSAMALKCEFNEKILDNNLRRSLQLCVCLANLFSNVRCAIR